jgi:hypothetical protein
MNELLRIYAGGQAGSFPNVVERNDVAKEKHKILILDIEWRPAKAYVWSPWGVNIYDDQVIEGDGLLCVGAQWLGEKEVHVFTEWELGHREMLERTRQMMSEADAIVGYNSDKYDLRKLEGEFILHKMKLPPPCPSIDLIKTIRKFGYFRNSLKFIGPHLSVGKKLENGGMNLWRKVEEGDPKAQDTMKRYCAQDVRMTGKLYIRVRPGIKNHPLLGDGSDECPACSGKHFQHRGHNRSRYYKTQRLQCQDCGHWFTGKRERIK